jgi:hypothetical protein
VDNSQPEKVRQTRRNPHREAGLLTLSELAKTRGHDYRTLARAVDEGKLRVCTFGGVRRYVRPEDYDAFVRGETQVPTA